MAETNANRAFFDASRGRPMWAPWGKAQPAERNALPAHPLLCHMIDVASVAEVLISERLPRGTIDRLRRGLGITNADNAWILFLVALHDLGKATPAFQAKWRDAIPHLEVAGFDIAAPSSARDHGTIGTLLVRRELERYGVDAEMAWSLARAVAAHHGTFPTDHDIDERRVSRRELGKADVWDESRRQITDSLAELYGITPSLKPAARDWAVISILAGLTSVADWVGSMAEVFVYEAPPTTLLEYVGRSRARAREALDLVGFRAPVRVGAATFDELFGFAPRPLQDAVASLVTPTKEPLCIVVEAPMGEGKTEAALFATHALAEHGLHDGAYIGLPTQATANQMFDRLASFLTKTRPDQLTGLHLLHGEAAFDTRVQRLLRSVFGGADSGLVCERWFLAKKRALLAPFGAGTVDQALLSVLWTKHAFVRQLGLAGKTVVLDEVHAYDTYTSTLLDRLVAWLGALGASVVILSATLPSPRRRALLEAYAGRPFAEISAEYPRISAVQRSGQAVSQSIEIGRDPTNVALRWLEDGRDLVHELTAQIHRGGVVGIVRNTVARAQATYRSLRHARACGALPPDTELLLLHARFPSEDRREREKRLVETIGKGGERPTRMVVVGTQVLEQSLDVDFDVLVSDIAPVDLVLQRAGRLHRHARLRRPPGAESPRLLLVIPAGDEQSCSLREVGGVYEPYILRRSLLLLRRYERVSLPQDIEGLVEEVYAREASAELGETLLGEKDAFERCRADEENLARQRAWPPPEIRDDPFGSWSLPLEEDNVDIARALRAETRLGEDSVDVVCLFGDALNTFLDARRTRPIDLSVPPNHRDVSALALRTVKVATRGLAQHIGRLIAPAHWESVSVLSKRRPLFFGSGPVSLDRWRVDLDPELGLVISTQEGASNVVSSDE